MNHNYIIILFFVFFLNVEKTYGCHPTGYDYCTDASQIQNVTFSPGKISVTTNIIQKDAEGNEQYTHALGHFTFGYSKNNKNISVRILKKPVFTNNQHCADKSSDQKNPLTSTWDFDQGLTPPSGTSVGVWLSTYWACNLSDGTGSILCSHEDISFTATA
ncbi:uncharacterized protein OCT59_027478 [Rhizophagus irregularis]|uniref:Uncharacterized protein n=3 Tax=Rhizophagus irregularis TaxID=588596 RepID=A0A2H5TQW6_RHIID|nr:hypothetical protein GLOIN_2v1883145 [Rhizophagus irregularis DAOM 181602=DAOM 197198]XP_025170323.1 hypothetical protein GLOIN_2v1882083 [Rhizophagus irregularis DAOM 181602=DAOM 197198]EXX64599.1 hypothetical protein RirG_141180 [Rhizophagus irregularis DAOM 197198w]UZO07183.1 hypothetical protein OCT59_027478 [Rhizophagus irregularis]POG62116.1 hypothetical protein GLOIN_2v1883145 [Rhizophagus irregularis DAOM 181602=DAOM 197198]POG63457.1 hypothetical protein GLOIN_2v1882083 [Rhizophagu|eukprot:XP_025168982.1 hypothetical protein GLOIN_2v1883145 [Rhizophagus irregularis DAOM 181602=DAOM 197198]